MAKAEKHTDRGIEAEHRALIKEQIALELEHAELRPEDTAGNRRHRVRLRDHITRLQAHIRRLRGGRGPR